MAGVGGSGGAAIVRVRRRLRCSRRCGEGGRPGDPDLIRERHALGDPVSAATLGRIRAMLRAALNVAVRRRLIAQNPASRRSYRGPGGRTGVPRDSVDRGEF
jgi:hypothetical protein